MRDDVLTEVRVQITVHYALFSKLWNAYISFVTSVRPSSRMYQLNSHWKDMHGIWCGSLLLKCFEEVHLWLIQSTWYFTWIP